MNKSPDKFKILKRIALIVIVYAVITSFYSVATQIKANNEQIASLDKQIAAEKKITQKLEDKKLKTDTDEYCKEVARDSLGLVNPGDKVYINSNNSTSK